MHEATFDAVQYLPAAHFAHAVAPGVVPVLVFDPALQLVHAAFDDFEYLPATHSLQEVAPTDEPVFVIEPAGQSKQFDMALCA